MKPMTASDPALRSSPRVTIVPRGQALGVTYQRPSSDRYNYAEAYLRARIVGTLERETLDSNEILRVTGSPIDPTVNRARAATTESSHVG